MTRKPANYWDVDTIAQAIRAFVTRYRHWPTRRDFLAANGLPSLAIVTRYFDSRLAACCWAMGARFVPLPPAFDLAATQPDCCAVVEAGWQAARTSAHLLCGLHGAPAGCQALHDVPNRPRRRHAASVAQCAWPSSSPGSEAPGPGSAWGASSVQQCRQMAMSL
jgi:hypothetical protein